MFIFSNKNLLSEKISWYSLKIARALNFKVRDFFQLRPKVNKNLCNKHSRKTMTLILPKVIFGTTYAKFSLQVIEKYKNENHSYNKITVREYYIASFN